MKVDLWKMFVVQPFKKRTNIVSFIEIKVQFVHFRKNYGTMIFEVFKILDGIWKGNRTGWTLFGSFL